MPFGPREPPIVIAIVLSDKRQYRGIVTPFEVSARYIARRI